MSLNPLARLLPDQGIFFTNCLFMSLFSFRKPPADAVEPDPPQVTPTHIYSVTLVYTDAVPVKLQFNADIRRIQPQVFSINRSEVLLNQALASNFVAADLAAQCGSVIYPLQVVIGDTGDIMSVWNYKEIVQRWHTQELKLHQLFSGEEAEDYIAATAATINDPALFLQSLRRDLFLTVYFKLLYAGRRAVQQVAYPLVPFADPIPYQVAQTRSLQDALPDEVHQRGNCPGGSLEIKATLTDSKIFLRLLEGVWKFTLDDQPKEVAIRVVCLSGEEENTTQKQSFILE